MNRINVYKFKFNYADKPESKKVLEVVYSRIFEQAYTNLTRKVMKQPIINSNDNIKNKQQ